MYVSYYDEAGDDGYPRYSSPLFVLSALYTYYLNWKDNFKIIQDFRSQLRRDYNFPVRVEMHTKQFLLNKKPYSSFRISDPDRLQIVDLFCELIGQLSVRIVNIVIVKPRLIYPQFKVLDTSLTYSVQRIENDLSTMDPANKFLVITDTGRVGMMRKTTRRVQKINFIPSKITAGSYRSDIRSLIEDPLPKDSKESYFIQLADVVSHIVYLYSLGELSIGKFPKRMPDAVDRSKVRSWMDKMKPSFNLKASAMDDYGIVFHPK